MKCVCFFVCLFLIQIYPQGVAIWFLTLEWVYLIRASLERGKLVGKRKFCVWWDRWSLKKGHRKVKMRCRKYTYIPTFTVWFTRQPICSLHRFSLIHITASKSFLHECAVFHLECPKKWFKTVSKDNTRKSRFSLTSFNLLGISFCSFKWLLSPSFLWKIKCKSFLPGRFRYQTYLAFMTRKTLRWDEKRVKFTIMRSEFLSSGNFPSRNLSFLLYKQGLYTKWFQ